MRVLILGGDGMLGHELYRELREAHETRVTVRQARKEFPEKDVFAGCRPRARPGAVHGMGPAGRCMSLGAAGR